MNQGGGTYDATIYLVQTAYVSFLFKALLRRAGEMSDHTSMRDKQTKKETLCDYQAPKKKKKKKKVRISNYFSAFAQNGYFYLFLPFFFVLVFRARVCVWVWDDKRWTDLPYHGNRNRNGPVPAEHRTPSRQHWYMYMKNLCMHWCRMDMDITEI